MSNVTHIQIRCLDNGETLTFQGREAWALHQLISAGEKGVTPREYPAPRWSGYVHDLRKRGLHIETITEPHGGPFAGQHGRYVLRTPVEVLAVHQAGEKRHA